MKKVVETPIKYGITRFIKYLASHNWVVNQITKRGIINREVLLARVVIGAVVDDVEIIEQMYRSDAEQLGWDSVWESLANEYIKKLSTICNLRSIEKGEINGLSSTTLLIIKMIFPNITQYDKPPPPL